MKTRVMPHMVPCWPLLLDCSLKVWGLAEVSFSCLRLQFTFLFFPFVSFASVQSNPSCLYCTRIVSSMELDFCMWTDLLSPQDPITGTWSHYHLFYDRGLPIQGLLTYNLLLVDLALSIVRQTSCLVRQIVSTEWVQRCNPAEGVVCLGGWPILSRTDIEYL